MFLTTTRHPAWEVAPDLWSRRMSRLFDEALNAWPMRDENGTVTSSWVPAVDVFEGTHNLKIVAEIPGVRPEDVKISLENNLLTIRGEKKQVAEEKTDRVHRYERAYGVFERSFSLPTTIDPDQIQARYDSGLLTIELPKAERARPREIPVTAS